MAYETGTATDIGDLVDKLFTFATGLTTTPWTENELDIVSKRQGTLTLGDCVVTFRWDNTTSTDLGLYQSLGWLTGKAAHEMTDDDGSGDNSVPINTGRRVNFQSTGPFTKYYFFAGEGDDPFIHVIVEVDAGRFRHFGFGNIEKHGTWTGGEYLYGHYWSQSTLDLDTPVDNSHSFGLDGLNNVDYIGASLHIENFAIQGAGEKWGVFTSDTTPINDRAGNSRKYIQGGMRQGFWGYALGWVQYSSPNLYKPLIPIPVIIRDNSPSPDTFQWLGVMPDVSIINMHAFTPAQEITIGSDTWVVFPWVRKQYLKNDTEESWNAGLAYKKVT